MSSTPFLDPITGRLEYYADSDLDQATLDSIQTRGLQPATPEDVAKRDRDIAAGTTGQQTLAQGERLVRGVTLGQVEGFGTDEEIRARADVSQREHPIISALADIAPDLALAAASGGAAGALSGGLKAGARAAVVGGAEALAGGAVGASQQAFQEGRQFLHQDLEADVENMALWTGLGGALSAVPAGVRALRGAKGARAAAETVEATADAAEAQALREAAGGLPEAATPAAPGTIAAVEGPGAVPVQMPVSNAGAVPLEAAEAAVPGRTGGRLAPDVPLEDQLRASIEQVQAQKAGAGGLDLSLALGVGLPPIRLGRRAASKVGPEAVRELAEEEVADGIDRAVRNATASEAEDVVTKATRGELEREAPSFARDRRLHDYRHEILETATKTVKGDLDELGKVHRSLTDVAVAKPQDIARNVGKNVKGQQAQVRAISKQAAQMAGQMRAEAAQFAVDAAAAEGRQVGRLRPRFASPQHRDFTASLMTHAKELEEAAASGNSAKMFEAVDNFKRVADDRKVAVELGAKNSNDPIHMQKLVPRVEEFAHSLRRSLEDADTWGRVGEMQADYNRIWHDQFIPASKVFNEATQKVTGRDYSGKLISEAWESKLDKIIQGADPGERRYTVQMLDAMKAGAEARLKYGAGTRAQVDDIVRRVDRIKKTFGLGDEVTKASQRMDALGSGLGAIPAIGSTLRAAATGDLGSKLRTLTGASDSLVDRSIDDWVRTSKVRGRGRVERGASARAIPRLPAAVGSVAALATRRGVTHTMAEFMGEDETPTAAFNRWRTDLMSDEAFFERVGKNFGSLAVESPAAMMALSAHAAKTRQFLLARMPPNIAVSMMNPRGYPPSRDAIEDWAIYVVAATNPNSIMRSIAKGDVQVQQAEVMRELYPRRFERVQEKLIEKISGETDLDDQFLIRQNLLFDIDGAGSPIFSARFAVNSGLATRQQPAQMGGGAPKPAGKTPTQMGPATVATHGATYGTL